MAGCIRYNICCCCCYYDHSVADEQPVNMRMKVVGFVSLEKDFIISSSSGWSLSLPAPTQHSGGSSVGQDWPIPSVDMIADTYYC